MQIEPRSDDRTAHGVAVQGRLEDVITLECSWL